MVDIRNDYDSNYATENYKKIIIVVAWLTN